MRINTGLTRVHKIGNREIAFSAPLFSRKFIFTSVGCSLILDDRCKHLFGDLRGGKTKDILKKIFWDED